MKIIRELLAEAVGPCPACDSTGWWNASRNIPCDECEGTGKKLTPEGSELVGFAAHWLKPHFADTDHEHEFH